ncbi:hypothetical protein D3Y57_05555 [Sphingomonas paeninsulae]|uniref:Holin n=1 Tax=Sphingomonas paeninsulae TaxID=2319844 RepID=A0A494TK95_SPHPE|nr:hypothetical protein D3Y57_05555 [Sphingomonas paeninsulae]
MTPFVNESDSLLTSVSKTIPPLAVTSVTVAGLSLQEWVYVATLVYTVLQIGMVVWRWFNPKIDK